MEVQISTKKESLAWVSDVCVGVLSGTVLVVFETTSSPSEGETTSSPSDGGGAAEQTTNNLVLIIGLVLIIWFSWRFVVLFRSRQRRSEVLSIVPAGARAVPTLVESLRWYLIPFIDCLEWELYVRYVELAVGGRVRREGSSRGS